MRAFSLAFVLLSAVGFLLWSPVTGLKTLHLGSCVITANLQAIQKDFSEIQDSVVRKGGNPYFLSICPLPPLSVCLLGVSLIVC